MKKEKASYVFDSYSWAWWWYVSLPFVVHPIPNWNLNNLNYHYSQSSSSLIKWKYEIMNVYVVWYVFLRCMVLWYWHELLSAHTHNWDFFALFFVLENVKEKFTFVY